MLSLLRNYTRLIRAEKSRHFAIYFLSSVLNKLLPFILLPVLTRFLDEEEFGALAIYQLLIVLSISIVGMNIQNNITKSFFDKTKKQISTLIGNIVFTLFSSLVFWSLVAAIFFMTLESNFLSISPIWFLLLPLVSFCSVVIELLLTVLRNRRQPLKFSGIEVGRSVFELGLTLYLVMILTMGFSGRVVALTISVIILATVSVFILRKSGYLSFTFDRSYINEILKISIPLIPHALAGVSLAMSNRLFLESIDGPAAVALFAVSYQFAMVLSLVTIALNRTWSPWLYKAISVNSSISRDTIVRNLYIYWVSVFFLSILVTAISYYLIPIMVPENYHPASGLVVYLAIGYSFYSMYNSIFPFFVYFSKTKLIAVITFTVALCNLLLNFFLIKEIGLVGASIAFLLSYFLLFATALGFVSKFYDMPWRRRSRSE